MKAIMISVKPEYTVKILNGEKILEIRKTIPKCELPCKVYIYCTKGSHNNWLRVYPFNIRKNIYQLCDDSFNALNGTVVAEFTLNIVEPFECASDDFRYLVENTKSCLTMEQVYDYSNGQTLYGWHIDNLKIYDKPKELSEFGIKRAFQSWGYIDKNLVRWE